MVPAGVSPLEPCTVPATVTCEPVPELAAWLLPELELPEAPGVSVCVTVVEAGVTPSGTL